jgi:dienelactone hydrolase
MMRWIACCVVFFTCLSLNAEDGFKFTAEYGTYAVGFKVVRQYDQSRSYRAGFDAITGEPDHSPSGRPIQTLIWYPAAAPGNTLTYGDYLDLAGSEDRFDLDAAQSHAITKAVSREYLAIGISLADIARVRAEAVRATSGAPPIRGKFPLIIYAASDSSSAFENDSLCEYLASHGYVVIASPSHGAHVRYMTNEQMANDLENTRAQAADIGFLIGYAESLAQVDSTKIGLVGYSWGGMAGTFAAVADSRINALVFLDGSIRYFPKLIAAAPDVTPDRIHVPLLFFADQEDPLAPGKDSKPNSFIAKIHHADVTEIGLQKLSHNDLAADSLRLLSHAAHRHTSINKRSESYAWVARYTLAFLDSDLKSDAAARRFMAATPEANRVPPGTLSIQHRASNGPGASVASFAQALAKGGFDHAVEIHATYIRKHPDFSLTDDMFDAWTSSLWDLAKPEEAMQLCRLWVHLNPKSTEAWTRSGIANEMTDQPMPALDSYRHALMLDHHNQLAAARVQSLASGTSK